MGNYYLLSIKNPNAVILLYDSFGFVSRNICIKTVFIVSMAHCHRNLTICHANYMQIRKSLVYAKLYLVIVQNKIYIYGSI